ncbi:hypothetical protein HBB16_09050 [Pseudonocardia sp. MCCB 268]|nr:hypothetical protein [Pseudonocardia cytotoxica]
MVTGRCRRAPSRSTGSSRTTRVASAVIHVDSDAPLHDDLDGSLITDRMWGICTSPTSAGGVRVQCVAAADPDQPAHEVAVDPYAGDQPEFVVDDSFVRMWTSAWPPATSSSSRSAKASTQSRPGGIGAFTPDSFPVFDTFCENAYFIADANHGYKMLGVGEARREAARQTAGAAFAPFQFNGTAPAISTRPATRRSRGA